MNLIFTLILFALLLYGINKKLDVAGLLLLLSLAALGYMTVVNGSVLGENTTGSAFMDIFEFITNSISGNIGGIILIVMIIIAYLEVLAGIHSTTALAQLMERPMSVIKSKYLIAACAVVLGMIFRLGITMGPAVSMLMIATFYPILRKAGCSKLTAASAMVLFNVVTWGPADSTCYTSLALMGLETDVTEWFTGMQIVIAVIFIISASIAFMISNRFFDGKEAEQEDTAETEQSAETVENAPVLYALFPLLPLILMFVFSPLLIADVKISVITACIISLLITAVIHAVYKKSFQEILHLIKVFYTSLGNTLRGLGAVIMFAMLFASCLNQIGGMQMIADAMAKLNMPPVIVALLLCAFTVIVTFVVGSFYGALSMSMPLAAGIAASVGGNPLLLCYLVTLSVGAGGLLSPVNPVMLTASKECGVPILQLAKRNVIPIIVGLSVAATAGTLIFS